MVGKVTLDTKIRDLEITIRLMNCLMNEFKPWGTEKEPTVRDVMRVTDEELLRIPNLGRKSLKQWKEVIYSMNQPMTEELAAEASALKDIAKYLKRIAIAHRTLATYHEALIQIIRPIEGADK